MERRKNLVAVDPSAHSGESPADLEAEASTLPIDPAPTPADEWVEDEPSPALGRFGWVLPAVALLAVAGWTAFFAWVHRPEMLAGASPAQWSAWVADWAVPVVLVIGLWLLGMRNSRREAARFGGAAQMLAKESALLERRLATVNRELSLARDFIAAQSRDLESLGRVAGERLSQHAEHLQSLIRDNSAQVETIGRVSTTALENMDRLRDDLPVISNSARDVASQIGHVGSVAKDQLEELVAGFNRLNEFGEASGRQVTALRGKVDDALRAFEAQAEHLGEIADNRFVMLAERSAEFRSELDGREIEAFAAVRRRADALREELSERQHELERGETLAIEGLRERMTLLRDEGMRLAETLRAGERDAAEAWSRGAAELEQRMLDVIHRITEVDIHALESARKRLMALSEEAQRIDERTIERADAFAAELARRQSDASERETAAIAELKERLAAFDAELSERQQEHLAHVAGLAERGEALSERLTELGAAMDTVSTQGRQTQDTLADSAAALSARLADSRVLIDESGTRLARLTDESVRLLELIRSSAEHTGSDLPHALERAEQRLTAFEGHVASVRELIAEAGAKGATLVAHMETARHNGSATLDELGQLEQRLADLARGSEALTEQARGSLVEAIETLERAASEAFRGLEERDAQAIREMAKGIAGQSGKAIEEALRVQTAEAIVELETAAREAGEVGRMTAIQLRDQLAAVNELAGNLESRVAYARRQAEEQVDSDFARRMALITESLNSSAIDISKAFATDVTDTAWSSYLRGDRGIFTRRAVRLLSNQDARAVSGLYEHDADFRETVNLYIRDFEAMLRSVLSTRDGHAMAVTLLSSDMGKLYVALAQAIERLRT